MKIIKLIIIFAVVLGGVLGVFFLIGDIDSNNELPPIPDETIKTYRSQFENDWKQKGDWDEDIFNSHCDLVNQLSVDNNITPLKELNTSTAIEVVHNKIFEEWSSYNCKKENIQKYINAIEIIKSKDNNAVSNPLVPKIKNVNNVYNDAWNLAYKKIGINPNFRINKINKNGKVEGEGNWNSFKGYMDGINSNKYKIMNDNLYVTYLSNISEIKNGLDEIPDKLYKARENFYNNLARQIIAHYNDINIAEKPDSILNSILKEFRSVRNKYMNEYKKNEGLNKAVRDFTDDINREKERRERIKREEAIIADDTETIYKVYEEYKR